MTLGSSTPIRLDFIFDFGSALSQVGPQVWFEVETVLVGSLGAPDDSGRSSGGIETGMGFVAFVGVTKLFVYFGVVF